MYMGPQAVYIAKRVAQLIVIFVERLAVRPAKYRVHARLKKILQRRRHLVDRRLVGHLEVRRAHLTQRGEKTVGATVVAVAAAEAAAAVLTRLASDHDDRVEYLEQKVLRAIGLEGEDRLTSLCRHVADESARGVSRCIAEITCEPSPSSSSSSVISASESVASSSSSIACQTRKVSN